MEFLQHLLDSAELPVAMAFLLGLMTAISPCPLATNITATAFISKDIANRRRIFLNGLIYTLGRAVSYTAVGLVIFFGASKFKVSYFFQNEGMKFLGPLLILVGIFMMDFITSRLPSIGNWTAKVGAWIKPGNGWSALLLGILFALAFCPYSGILYFGMLIPVTVASAKGLYLPAVFAFATGLPVIIVAWFLAYSVSGIGTFYNRLKVLEKWFRRIAAAVFIAAGIYYTLIYLVLVAK
jgi:cytochrome c-type biogenesis protein